MNKKRQGFSIVSFLIALIVIAFGYSLVMPSLLQYVHQSKKVNKMVTQANSPTLEVEKTTAAQNINQASSLILQENNFSLQNLCNSNDCFRDLYAQKLSIISTCTEGNIEQCWHKKVEQASAMSLTNGMLVLFRETDPSCTNQTCGKLYVDINGFKAPNSLGADIIGFNISPNSVTALSN